MEWVETFALVFGGCCSNAITLEQLTSQSPDVAALLTFLQFLLITLYGLLNHLIWTSSGPRFQPRKIPLTPYLIQVAFFYVISLLNNAAFAYEIPMTVHIIFRSGGLAVSMLLGWILGKRYTLTQVIAVMLVTTGVTLSTLSASYSYEHGFRSSSLTPNSYTSGIVILALALVLSGFLGLIQDRTYETYGRRKSTFEKNNNSWQESMFYLHFLALPMFFFVRSDILSQLRSLNSGPTLAFTFNPLPQILAKEIKFTLPRAYVPLMTNIITQLFCVSGVHRLTTRFSALTVTLVLVVRKAVSLVLSAVGVGLMYAPHPEVDPWMMWGGALMVLIGTITYSIPCGLKVQSEKTE